MTVETNCAATGRGGVLDGRTRRFYCYALQTLREAGARFLVGGAYAFARYTGIERHTKDLDIFVRPADIQSVLRIFAEAGYRSELTFPHWLGKVYFEDDCVDIIFSSGNGLCEVDDEWFDHAVAAEILGEPVRLIPAEEMLWSKGFVQERERYDGADVAHLLRASGRTLNWERVLRRYGEHWRVLYSHLVLFGFIYPDERDTVPADVLRGLARRLEMEAAVPSRNDEERICHGTLISREQYLTDITEWGYRDGRLVADAMAPHEIQHWTNAIGTIE